MSYALITDPGIQIVTTAEAKAQLNIDYSTDDTLIDSIVKAVQRDAMAYCWRSFCNTVWEKQIEDWPKDNIIKLGKGDVSNIASVKYLDANGVWQTMVSGTDYVTDTTEIPALVKIINTFDLNANAIKRIAVRFTAGYGATAASVPDNVKLAIKLAVGHYYRNREDVVMSAAQELPMGSRHLLAKEKINTYL